uniref:sensor histidine kinase n=1 Tax=Spirosoma sp. TaxID=1899569 RepID=UPI003B3BE3C7
ISLLWLLSVYSFRLFARPLDISTLKYSVEFLMLSTVTWEAVRWVLLRFRLLYPHLHQTRKRILIVLPLCWLVAVLIDWIDMVVVNNTGYHAPYPKESFVSTVPSALLYCGLIIGVQEAVYYFNRLLKSEKEAETLKKENLQTQLDSLKQQVNPHFLFNSLNTLSYLIGDDTEKAEDFLNEMCKVYRYLLRSNEHELTDLGTELQFIRSYFHLLKTRYGDNIQLNLSIEPPYETYLLPSLTLQLLIENAVKHNVIDKTQPLIVDVTTQPTGLLTVKNNLQKKEQQLPSTKIGLRNIATKFRLLNQGDILVRETVDEFAVTIPLIAAGRVGIGS